jgi:hypothetical protein
MIKTFLVLFGLLTLIHIPVMGIYGKHGAYNEEPIDKSPIKVSLGAMGYAKSKCTSTGVATDKIVLSCKTGFIG